MEYLSATTTLSSKYEPFIKSTFFIETINESLTMKNIPLFCYPFILYRISHPKKTGITLKPVSLNQSHFYIKRNTGSIIYFVLLLKYELHYIIHENQKELSHIISFTGQPEPEEIAIKTAEKALFDLQQYHQEYRNPILEEALKLMQQHPPGINATKIAQQLRISARHLRRLVRQQTGLSPKTIIRLSRLKDTYLHISQGMATEKALFHNGYYDFSHFSKDSQSLLHLKPHNAKADTVFLNAVSQIFSNQISPTGF